jgi:hypothetical protein
MMPNVPEMPQHLILALDRHQRLIEEASRQRQRCTIRRTTLPHAHPLRWHVGEWLIRFGQRLQTGNVESTKTVWG